MSDEAALEVYRQRYETFRHLDNVRYQAQNLAVVFVSALIAGLSSGNIKLEWWAFGLSGLVTLLLSYSIHRINKGIADNSIALAEFGNRVGDTALAPLKVSTRSSAVLFSILLGAIGFTLCAYSLHQACKCE